MQPFLVIDLVDKVRDLMFGIGQIQVVLEVYLLAFQGSNKAFGKGVLGGLPRR